MRCLLRVQNCTAAAFAGVDVNKQDYGLTSGGGVYIETAAYVSFQRVRDLLTLV